MHTSYTSSPVTQDNDIVLESSKHSMTEESETTEAWALSPDAKTMIYKYTTVGDSEHSGLIIRFSNPNIPPIGCSLGAVARLGSISFILNEILYISDNHFLDFYHIPSQSFILSLINEDNKIGGKVTFANDKDNNTCYITTDTEGLPPLSVFMMKLACY